MKKRRANNGGIMVVKVIGGGGMSSRDIGSKRIVGEGRRHRRGKPIPSRDLVSKYGIPRESLDRARALPEVKVGDLLSGDLFIGQDGKMYRVKSLDVKSMRAVPVVGSGTVKSRKAVKFALGDSVHLFRRGGVGRDVHLRRDVRRVDVGHRPDEPEFSPHRRGRRGGGEWVGTGDVDWTQEVNEAGADAYTGENHGGRRARGVMYDDERGAMEWA